MNAKELLIDIFKTKTVSDENGNEHTLTSNIDQKEGEFLYDIISKHKPVNTIEIGCAMGISSLYICSALNEFERKHHTIIDPLQSSDWANIGKTNLDRANVNFYDIIEQPSEIVLPQLLSQNKQYDFGFIDGWHTFDHTLVDFFYLNRLIKVGGIIVIDDITFSGIKKVMRYILNYSAYELLGRVELETSQSIKRYLYDNTIPYFFKCLSAFFPKKMRYKLFAGNVLDLHKNKQLNSSMIALRKIKEDDRRWDWFVEF